MLHFIKLLICPFRNNLAGEHINPAKAGIYSANRHNCAACAVDCPPSASPGQPFRGNDEWNISSGAALLFVMLAATIILIGLTAALPSIYQEDRRERELELIFRGRQYARAIAGFHKKFQRFPSNMQELTNQTNGWRFLRKEFTDPMTPNGKWRLIHVNAQGMLLDSKTQGAPQGQQGAGGQGAGGLGTSGSSGMGGSSLGQQGMGANGFGQQDMGASGFGQQGTGGSGFGQQGMGGSGFGQQGTGGSGFAGGSGPGGLSSGNSSSGGTQQSSGFSSTSSQGGGTYIAGVASTNHKESIRVYNHKTHYDEWEFLGIDLGALGFTTSIPGLPQGVGGQSGQGAQPNTFGQPNQGAQPSTFGQPNQGNSMTPGQNQGMFSQPGGSTSSPQ